ncbi:MAG: hydantoinase/carbamoylase family amidase, partial [Alphaproteobacteria bacterium]
RADRRLLIGSHIDTVVDGGRFDGALGVITGIVAAEHFAQRIAALPFSLEVLAFGDEEGGRFPVTLTASSAVAGCLDPRALQCVDGDGQTLSAALRDFGGDPDQLEDLAYRPNQVAGYLEVHTEQGPVLEARGRPLGVVSAIAGQARFQVHVGGEAGHAGTVPMDKRRDALAAAAEMAVMIETEALKHAGASLVATVGAMTVEPGAVNVIPGAVTFSLDVRAAEDQVRHEAIAAMEVAMVAIAARRRVTVTIERVMEKTVAQCAPRLQHAIGRAIVAATGHEAPVLMSGAGHDGHAMIRLTDIGMIFVRCRDGTSHNPVEFVSAHDMGQAVDALVKSVEILAAEEARA